MLGRHVYRVSLLDRGGWRVQKEGEATARATPATRDEATRLACDLAAADTPSRVVVEEEGAIVTERLFGADTALELERQAEGKDPNPPEPPRR
jgi:hypothetical protein